MPSFTSFSWESRRSEKVWEYIWKSQKFYQTSATSPGEARGDKSPFGSHCVTVLRFWSLFCLSPCASPPSVIFTRRTHHESKDRLHLCPAPDILGGEGKTLGWTQRGSYSLPLKNLLRSVLLHDPFGVHPRLSKSKYHRSGNKYTSNSWRLFDMYVFVLSSVSLTKKRCAYVHLYVL